MHDLTCLKPLAFVAVLLTGLSAQAGTIAPTGCPQELALRIGEVQPAPLDDVIRKDHSLLQSWAALQNAPELNLQFQLHWKSDVELAPGAPENWRVVRCYYKEVNCQGPAQSCAGGEHLLSFYADPVGVNDQYRFNTQFLVRGQRFDLNIPLKSFSDSQLEVLYPSASYPLVDWGTDQSCNDPFMGCARFQYPLGAVGVLTLKPVLGYGVQ